MISFARNLTPQVAHEATARASWLRRLARNRVVQFSALGGLVFVAGRANGSGRSIHLRQVDLAALSQAEAARVEARPEAVEGEVLERVIEDEVLYREGVALGFDKSDAIVRQRVIQKTLFLAEELAGAGEPPTEAELRAFYDETRSEWRQPEEWRFTHVFLRDPRAIAELARRASAGDDLAAAGDPCPVPREASATAAQLESALGRAFVEGLRGAPPGTFGAPLRSALGWHLVRVESHSPARPATFDEVKGALPGAFVARRREKAVSDYLERSFRDYEVTVDGRRVDGIHPRRRVALRSAGSAED